jgi:hypothetical protein
VTVDQLLIKSEDLRKLQDEWRRWWTQPSHLPYVRVHGGIGP